MTPDQYHSILVGLDRVLQVLHDARADHSPEDRELLHNLELIRSRVLKSESGHPFALKVPNPPGQAIERGTSEAPSTPSQPAEAAAVEARPIRVLIVDDEDSVRSVLRMLLGEESDFEMIAEARNGKEAIEMATAFQPDVIIMDLNMPVLDGFAATREALRVSPKTKVIVFSANHDQTSIRLSANAGAVGYITKPVNRRVLVSTIRDVYRGATAFADRDPTWVAQQP